jgi:hypothetical protein
MQPTHISLGSIWKTRTKRHFGHLRKIVGFNKNNTIVRVQEYTKKHKQHANRIYSIHLDAFAREHEIWKE